MKFTATQAAAYGAAVLLATQPCLASSSHRHHHPLNRKHVHEHQPVSAREGGDVTERGLATCPFPTGVGLVAITPDKDNAGWAMSPDQFCTRGSYCPYACPPGQMMAQWKKSSGYYTGDRMVWHSLLRWQRSVTDIEAVWWSLLWPGRRCDEAVRRQRLLHGRHRHRYCGEQSWTGCLILSDCGTG